MLKKIYFLGLFLLASILLNAEEPAFFSNATNNSGRFEIIQSPLEKKYTFKLDKKTGETWHLQGNIKSIHWHKMPTIADDINYEEHNINYQIFLGGDDLNDCFLINIHTGKTWVLLPDKTNFITWKEVNNE